MKKLGQKGFSLVEAVLIFVIVALIAGVGYYVYQSQKKTNESLDKAAQNSEVVADGEKKTEAETKPAADPTADWAVYSNSKGQFSFKYPKTWAQASRPELCADWVVLMGADKISVGKCGSDSAGQISFAGQSDMTATVELTKNDYPDLKEETITLNGVKGVKQTGTYKPQPTDPGGIGPQEGDKFVQYVFRTNNRTYSAQYFIPKTNPYPDVLDDFNTLVVKTFKFQP